MSESIVQNILYLQHIANSLPNAFTNQKCHQIIFLQFNVPERVKCHSTPIRGGEVWSQARNTTYYKHPREQGETSSKTVNANQHHKCCQTLYLWIYSNPKPMNTLHSKAQYHNLGTGSWNALILWSWEMTQNLKGLISHNIYIDSDQSIKLKTTNLSTYTPIENCYTPLTGSRPKSPRQSVNKLSKGGN